MCNKSYSWYILSQKSESEKLEDSKPIAKDQTIPLSNDPIKKTQKPEKNIPAESLKAPNKHVDRDEIISPTQTPEKRDNKQEKMDTHLPENMDIDADTDSEITPSVEVN